MRFLAKASAAIAKAITFVRSNPAQWAAETTTMVGLALIGLAWWEVFAGALTTGEAMGLVTTGIGLLYPQSVAKQQATATVVNAVLEETEQRRKHIVDPIQGQEHAS